MQSLSEDSIVHVLQALSSCLSARARSRVPTLKRPWKLNQPPVPQGQLRLQTLDRIFQLDPRARQTTAQHVLKTELRVSLESERKASRSPAVLSCLFQERWLELGGRESNHWLTSYGFQIQTVTGAGCATTSFLAKLSLTWSNSSGTRLSTLGTSAKIGPE